MARIRRLEIDNFRSIRHLAWDPSPGINCLIGQGDSGKSTVLDAIDLCLSARRNLAIDDSDFSALDTGHPIRIEVTLGELDDSLKNLDAYGLFLRGRDPTTGLVDDEPGMGLETVITVRLAVEDDLEPQWRLVSDRAEQQGQARGLSWADRVNLSPARIGVGADYHLRWSRGSVLTRISDEKPEVRSSLAAAGRNARETFGAAADTQLGETLAIVGEVAKDLGIPVGDAVRALLDVHAISFGAGVIALHSDDGVPLRRLGIGSVRLLIAGLQRRAASGTTVLLDEVEYGLEPHRIVRLLQSLGSKEGQPPLQVFMTTHSPAAVEELRGDQLFVTRGNADEHRIICAGTSNEIQGALRKAPSAFLAESVVACEGGSEVGLLRGIDLHRAAVDSPQMAAQGAALADLGGGDPDRMLRSARAFQELGYRTAFVRDSDRVPDPALEAQFITDGGHLMCCDAERALEEELLLSLSSADVGKLVDLAAEFVGEGVIDQQIKSASGNAWSVETIKGACSYGSIDVETREMLGRIAKGSGWFKTISRMERVGLEVVGPGLAEASTEFRGKVDAIFSWISGTHA